MLLSDRLDAILLAGTGDIGYIKMVPGTDHGSVLSSTEARVFPREMVEVLRAAGLLGE